MGGGAQDPDSPAGVSITASTCSRAPDRVTVSKKSQASRAPSWEAQETGPRGGTALGRRVDPGIVQDLHTVEAATFTPGHQQLAMHPAIPPPGILADQPQHQDAQQREHVRHTEVGQSQQHGRSPCHNNPPSHERPADRHAIAHNIGLTHASAPTSMDEVFRQEQHHRQPRQDRLYRPVRCPEASGQSIH